MITIMIPALNEEENIKPTVNTIIAASRKAKIRNLEIVIVNDGSTDRTGARIAELERQYPFVRSISHPKNLGIGVGFFEALRIAKYENFTVFPGDNYSSPILIENLLSKLNQADLVISYTLNTECRTRFRNLVSTIYCTIYMLVFDIHVKYINGSVIFKTEQLKALRVRSRGYSVWAEIVVKLLRKGVTYHEVPGYMQVNARKSSAIRIKNFLQITYYFVILLVEIFIAEKKLYSGKSTRIY